MAIDLDTGEEKNCAPMPIPMYKPAVTQYSDDKIIVIGKLKKVFAYDISSNTWKTFKVGMFECFVRESYPLMIKKMNLVRIFAMSLFSD